MSQPEFALGVSDARAGLPHHPAFEKWDTDGQWNYERGRQWATLTPRDVPVKVNGKVNPEALKWLKSYGDAIR